jgi:hypothetical protein
VQVKWISQFWTLLCKVLVSRRLVLKGLVCTMRRHLVVAVPGAAFATNRDVAAFVAQLLGDDPLAGPYAVAKVQYLLLCSTAC